MRFLSAAVPTEAGFHETTPRRVGLLVRDVEALHRALAGSDPEVKVALSRETADLMSQPIDARTRGEEIVVTPGNAQVTPTEQRCHWALHVRKSAN